MTMLVITIILVALVFDFLNGFHDSANSIATIVSTRVLTPRKAVLWAAFFNLVAAFFFDVHVAKTIGKGLVELAAINECAGLPAGTNMSAESAVYQSAAPIPAVTTSAALPPTVPAASAQICAQQMVGGTSYACQ